MKMTKMSALQGLVGEFVERLTKVVEQQSFAKLQAAIGSAGLSAAEPKARRGRPPGSRNHAKTRVVAAAPVVRVVKKARKKAPPQLCPVPDCQNKAAPKLGMLCSEHKDTPKKLVHQYREARRQAKLAAINTSKAAKKAAKHAAKSKAHEAEGDRAAA